MTALRVVYPPDDADAFVREYWRGVPVCIVGQAEREGSSAETYPGWTWIRGEVGERMQVPSDWLYTPQEVAAILNRGA